jgi:uncharacterized protein involved in exopolysaccharide biosynthesis
MMDASDLNRLKRYLIVFARGLLVVVCTYLITVAIGQRVIRHTFRTVYTATAQFQLLGHGAEVSDFNGDSAKLNSDDARKDLEMMESNAVLQPVLDRLNLAEIWGQGTRSHEPLSNEDALGRLRRSFWLAYRENSGVVLLTAQSNMAREASDIANALTDSYRNGRDALQARMLDDTKNSLRQQIADQTQVIAARQNDLEKLRQSAETKLSLEATPSDDLEVQAFHEAEQELTRQQSIAHLLQLRLEEAEDEGTLRESPVRIITEAQVPHNVSDSYRGLRRALQFFLAPLVALSVASSVEILFLLARASERVGN